MTYMTEPSELRADSGSFQVGDFALYAQRTCAQAREHFGLSKREVEVVMLVGAGLTKLQIADKLGVAAATADTFRRRAYVKLGVRTGSAAAAIMTAFMAGGRVEERGLERAA